MSIESSASDSQQAGNGSLIRKDENSVAEDHTPRPSRAASPYVVSVTPGRELAADDANSILQEKKEESSGVYEKLSLYGITRMHEGARSSSTNVQF